MLDRGMQIRRVTDDDMEQVNRVRQDSYPWHTNSVESQRAWLRSMPEAARRLDLVAEQDGRIIACGSGQIELTAPKPHVASAGITVHPDFRRQGVASALYAQIESHLRDIGARTMQIHALDEPYALDWGKRLGFELGAQDRFLVVDPRALPPAPPAPDGVSVVSIGEAGPEAVFGVDDISARDEPGDVGYAGMPYEEWLQRFWALVDHDVSMVAVVDGTPAAITLLQVNRETGRAMSNGSGTLREFRGRGLVKLAKSVSLRRAADAGVTQAFTGNDETNKPMLAINSWLGYQFVGGSRSLVKQL